LSGPVEDLRFIKFFAALAFFLLNDELVKIAASAKLHNDVELLPLDDRFTVGHDVGMLECLKKFDFVEYVLGLLAGFIGQLDLFDHIVFIFQQLSSQVGVPESPYYIRKYPCPIIFKILYCSIIM
jgi:hypothetical protein